MKFIRPAKLKTQSTNKKRDYSRLIITCLLIVFFLKIFVNVHRSISGSELVDIERQEAELVNLNQDLKKTMVEKTSLTNLQKIAEDSDFTSPQDILYIKSEDSFAQAR